MSELSGEAIFVISLILISLGILLYAVYAKKQLNNLKSLFELKVEESKKDRNKYNKELKHLNDKYKDIIDSEAYCEKIRNEIEMEKDDAITLKSQSREKLKLANLEAGKIINNSNIQSRSLLDNAHERAKEIAGDAYKIKEKAELYEKTAKAMKNTINGYKDEYMIPNHSLLDELAEEFSYKECGEKLKIARIITKEMIKNGHAGDCDYVENHRKTYAINFVIDAFNGKVDSALAKVKHDNYGKIKQEIIDAFSLVNHNGEPFRSARITNQYLDARLDELKWAVITHEVRQAELIEQREIKQQIREEEKAQKEIEKAIKEAEKEEKMLQKALEKARKELSGANEAQKKKFEEELAELEEKLKAAEEKGQRSLSMAQQTKRGHVYIISNIGSFGEDVYKIGMTRRLEPMDRVKELGDASVPFSFDVHAMLYSEDAPALEKSLHRQFDEYSVNKINPRKEFFKVSLTDIKSHVENEGIKAKWTLKAEAQEFRESSALNKININ